MRKNILHINEKFLKVHPDIASLFEEVKAKEAALEKLKSKKKNIKDELKALKNELDKRLTVIEAWQERKNDSDKKTKQKGQRAPH